MFEVGDVVVRTKGAFAEMRKGDIGTIIYIKNNGNLVIKEFCNDRTSGNYDIYPGHDSSKFVLAKKCVEENEL